MSVLIIYYSVFVHEGGRFRFLSAFVVVFAQQKTFSACLANSSHCAA
jgi:hypothetical protein